MYTVYELVEELFRPLSYSKQAKRIKTSAYDALEREYAARVADGTSELRAICSLMYEFSTPESAATASGVSADEYLAAVEAVPTLTAKKLSFTVMKLRLVALFAALFLSGAVINLMRGLILLSPVYLINIALALVLAYPMYRRYKKLCSALEYERICLSPDTKEKLFIYSDKYKNAI